MGWRKGLWLRIPFSTFGPSIIWDVQSLSNPSSRNAFLGVVPFLLISDWRLSLHSVGRSIVIWLAIIHPITVCLVTAEGWASGAVRAGYFVIVPYGIHGCLFYIFSQLSHVQQKCFNIGVDEHNSAEWRHQHPYDKNEIRYLHAKARLVSSLSFPPQAPMAPVKAKVDKGKCIEGKCLQEWAVHQVEHALDYAVDSKFWLHVSNGLNLQVVHHLFPQIGWSHYRELSVIIQEVCDSFGTTYAIEPTFCAAAASHFAHLTRINDEPLASVWIRPPVGYAPEDVMDKLDQVDWISDPVEPRMPSLARSKHV